MTYFLCPEKLFVFFCLHPPLRPLTSYLRPCSGVGGKRERHRETRGGIIFRPKTKESLSSDDKTLSWEGSYTIAPQNSGPSWCRRVKSPNDGQDCDLYVGQCQASKFWILQPRGRWSFCIMFFFICKTLFRLCYASMKASELGGANKTCIIWIVQPNSCRAARGWRCDVFPFYAQCCEVVSSLQSNIFIYTFFHLKSNKLNIVHHLMWIYLFCVKQKQKQTSAKIQAKRVKWGEHFWSVVESSY